MILPASAWTRADDYAMTFGSESGRRTLQDLEREAYAAGQDILADYSGPIDPYLTHARVGMRQLYDYIRRQLALARVQDRQFTESDTSERTNAFGDKEPE